MGVPLHVSIHFGVAKRLGAARGLLQNTMGGNNLADVGVVAEWLKAAVLKTAEPETVP